MFPECSYVRALVNYLLRGFDQTFTTNGLQNKDGGQKVKGQGHGGVKYAPKCTFWPCYFAC